LSNYTFCDKLGHRLFVRYIDDKGKRHQHAISETPLELFIPGTRKDGVGLFGETLSKMEFSSIEDMVDFTKEYDGVTDVYGQTSPAHQYIAKNWPGKVNFNMNHIKTLNFDIEVDSRDGFPHPDKAAYEVTSIAMKVFGENRRIAFGLKDYTPKRDTDEYIQCRDERDLLIQFIQEWKRINPDIITGWYIDGFDIPYIINRIVKILGMEWAVQLSPYYHETKHVLREIKVGHDTKSYAILGITTFDYQNLYMKFSTTKLESYSLNAVGEHEKVGQKVDYSEQGYKDLNDLYDNNFELFIDYNFQDVELVEDIDRKLKFILCAVNIAYLTHSRFSEALATVKPWDNFIYNMLLDDGVQIPPPKYSAKDKDIVGAYVKVPVPGKYKWLVAIDMTALYPSVNMMYNMSPETLVYKDVENPMDFMEKVLGDDPTVMKVIADRIKEGLCTASNGSSWSQEKMGVIPRGMKMLFDTRKDVKGTQMKKAKKALEAAKTAHEPHDHLEQQVQMLDAYQQALKVVANGGYGAMSNVGFRYFSIPMAEGITITGQMTIKYAAAKVNELLNKRFKTTDIDYVVYTDTDSCYITVEKFVTDILKVPEAEWPSKMQKLVDAIDMFVKTEIDPMFTKAWEELCLKVGAKNNTMDMKRESICDVGILRGRKNYILRVWDNEGVRYSEPEVKTVGVEAKRTSTPMISRNGLKECYGIMLDKTNEDLLQYLKKFKSEFMNASVRTIAFPRGVSELKKWQTNGPGIFEKGTPINSRAAIYFNKLVKELDLEGELGLIQEGNKIRFVYLKEPNPLRSNVIGFIDDLPGQFELDKYVDRDLQWTKTFLEPLMSFTDIIGWAVEKRQTLDDLWS
jgi:DNA polymerase elongation subunit (family B)